MPKLKTILQSKYTIILLIILLLFINYNRIKSDTVNKEDNITGIVKVYTLDNNKLSLVVKNTLINYYLDESSIPNISLGDTISVTGISKLPRDNTNFHLFNYRLYLKNKNTSTNKTYLNAFILGDSSTISDDVVSSYRINGISHLFALSGMHISLLSCLILYVLNRIKKTDLNYLITIILLMLYTILVSYTPSIMRSFFLFMFIKKKKKTKLLLPNYIIMFYITFFFLLYNPYYIYNVGFLFSFTISFFLLLYGNNKIKNYFLKLLITSFIAFISSIPIVINTFFEINLLTPLINLIFVPLISFVLFPLSLLTFFIPALSSILNTVVNIEENLSLIISNYHLSLTLSYIPWYMVIIYYIIIIIILENIRHYNYKYIVLIYIVLLIHTNIPNYKYELHIIDVGQGDSILIRDKDTSILVDTGGIVSYGNPSTYSIVESVTIPYLKSLGIKKLDYLVLSHGDYDHAGEAMNLINNFKVDKVILNSGSNNKTETNIINLLNTKNIQHLNINTYTFNVRNDGYSFLNRKWDN